MKKKSILAITIAALALVWILAVVAYTMVLELPWLCFGSITCTVIAIIIAEVYLLALRKDPGEQATEPGALGIILTIVFIIVVVLLNSVFVLRKFADFNWILLTLNAAIIVCYVLLLLWVEKSTARLANQLAKTEQKTAASKEISRKLGELLAITADTELRAKLLKLKEAVDYSTNISTEATAYKENQMNAQLDELFQLIVGRAEQLIILKKIEAVEMTWKTRSSAASSLR